MKVSCGGPTWFKAETRSAKPLIRNETAHVYAFVVLRMTAHSIPFPKLHVDGDAMIISMPNIVVCLCQKMYMKQTGLSPLRLNMLGDRGLKLKYNDSNSQ